MRALRLAISFLMVPRLFASLILLPLILSLILVLIQLLITGTVIRASQSNSRTIEKTIERQESDSLVRKLLYGSGQLRPQIQICYWKQVVQDGQVFEVPSGSDCSPDRLDVALRSDKIELLEPQQYANLFNGHVDRLHVCQSCSPDTIIQITELGPETHIHSIQALMLLSLASVNTSVREKYLEAAKFHEDGKLLIGPRYLHADGLTEAVQWGNMTTYAALVCSICSLIIIALWLALKAHRKILDYFSRNGALLPMVAATGKRDFYASLWILTGFRVGAFLLASVPMTVFAFLDFVKKEKVEGLFLSDTASAITWLLAITSSMALATLIASIADLKHRQHIANILYRYVPLLVCLLGVSLWALSFLFEGNLIVHLRTLITTVPIIGTGPVLVAPIFKPQNWVLLLHAGLTSSLLLVLLRKNAQWFAAHLEEI